MANDLITLEEFKLYANIQSTNNDELLASLIVQTSAFVKNYCARAFNDYIADDKTEYWGKGGPEIFLKEYPILDVTSVEMSVDYGTTYTKLVKGTEYAINYENDSIIPLGVSEFPAQANAIRINYTAGYETLPEDLKLAALDMVMYYYKKESTPKVSAGSTTVENFRGYYITSSDVPAHIKRVLELYRTI